MVGTLLLIVKYFVLIANNDNVDTRHIMIICRQGIYIHM